MKGPYLAQHTRCATSREYHITGEQGIWARRILCSISESTSFLGSADHNHRLSITKCINDFTFLCQFVMTSLVLVNGPALRHATLSPGTSPLCSEGVAIIWSGYVRAEDSAFCQLASPNLFQSPHLTQLPHPCLNRQLVLEAGIAAALHSPEQYLPQHFPPLHPQIRLIPQRLRCFTRLLLRCSALSVKSWQISHPGLRGLVESEALYSKGRE